MNNPLVMAMKNRAMPGGNPDEATDQGLSADITKFWEEMRAKYPDESAEIDNMQKACEEAMEEGEEIEAQGGGGKEEKMEGTQYAKT